MNSLNYKLNWIIIVLVIILLVDLVYYSSYLRAYQVYEKKNETLPPCPEKSPLLLGIKTIKREIMTWRTLNMNISNLLPGGHYKPTNCQSSHRVAIIVPYRKRDAQLRIFINNLHPFLQRQQLDYRIFIIQQLQNTPFNRGMLMNIGFVEANNIYNFTCFIFHDVDLIPENDKNPYNCVDSPRHLSVAVDIFKYKLPFKNLFGGVTAMQTNHFRSVNGFSNRFSGWGGEDDDLFNRVSKKKMSVFRYSENISRYTMIRHVKQNPNPERFKILKDQKYETDGLNSLDYRVDLIEERHLFTLISVYLDSKAKIMLPIIPSQKEKKKKPK